MKKFLKLSTLLFALIIALTGCKKSTDNNNSSNAGNSGGGQSGKVTVTTYNPTDITESGATCGMEAYPDDINYLLEIGVCWSTSAYPTVNANYTSTKNVDEPFICTLTDLEPETNYHVRAYALYNSKYYYGEDKSFKTMSGGNSQLLPNITTKEIHNIRLRSAIGGGVIINSNSSSNIIESGICWSINHEPDVNDNFEINSSNNDDYEIKMLFLTANTTYYVRAYAINNYGIGYGNEICFNTLDKINAPTGALNSLFSVSDDKEVYFSNGNLQYLASTDNWYFAEDQWKYIGQNNVNISPNYDGRIDLFGWGTSGYNHGAVCYQPWSISGVYENYYVYGSNTYNLYNQTGLADWGCNQIVNGGNVVSKWRTLTNEEWNYVSRKRTTSSGARYAKACVCGVNGGILFPDDWSTSIYFINNINISDADYNANIINASDWQILNNEGVVFLPAAGYRTENSLNEVGIEGVYWSASIYDSWLMSDACTMYISNEYFLSSAMNRSRGLSVRLVQDHQ